MSKWVIKHNGQYLAIAQLAPVPFEHRTTDRARAMQWNSLTDALRALRALKLDAFGAGVNQQ